MRLQAAYFCLFDSSAVSLLAWRSGHKRITAGYCWFIAAWLPISGIFPLNAPLAEHWMYVPMAGILVGIAGDYLAGRQQKQQSPLEWPPSRF
jgi:hypothetical protein